jgi:hypothetical protein
MCAGVSSCVDNKYRIEEIDTEAEFAPNGLDIPLVTIEKKTIEDMLGNTNLGEITVADGLYTLRYESEEPQLFTVAGITVPSIGDDISGALSGIDPVALDVPDFDFSGETEIPPLNLPSEPLSLPDGLLEGVAVVAGLPYGDEWDSNNGKIELDVLLPEELAAIGTVYLGDTEAGSPITMGFNLGGLAPVTGSLSISLNVKLPERYTLGLANNNNYGGAASVNGNTFTLTGYAVPNPTSVEIQFCVKEIDLSDFDLDAIGHHIDLEEDFNYHIEYALITKAGTTGSAVPNATFTGAPAFRDATFTISPDTANIAGDIAPIEISLDDINMDLPEEVDALTLVGVDFTDGEMTIGLSEPLNLPFAATPAAGVKVTFPEMFRITPENPAHLAGNVLTIPIADLNGGGYTLNLTGLDWGGGVPVDGALPLGDIKVELVGKLKENMRWSEDVEGRAIPAELGVNVSMDAGFALSEVRVKLDMNISKDVESIDLGDLPGELRGDNVTAALLPPALTLDINNPAGITVEGTITLAPKGENGDALDGVEAVEVPVTVAPGDNKLFIVDTDDDRAVPDGYTREPANLAELFLKIPYSLDISLAAGTNPETIQTVPLDGEEMAFSIDWGADLALGFGPETDVTYSFEEDMKDTFKDLAKMNFKAKQISVSAEISASFPLRVGDIALELLDAGGDKIEGLKTFVQGAIEGPAPDAGGVKTSTLTIGLGTEGESDYSVLSQVQTLKVSINASTTGKNPGDKNYIRSTDYISGRAYGTVKGVSADLEELMNGGDDNNE